MLLEGNTCDGTEAFNLFNVKEPIKFNIDTLDYLSNEK